MKYNFKLIKKICLITCFSIVFLFFSTYNLAIAGFINPDVFEEDQDEIFAGSAGYADTNPLSLAQIVGVVIQAFLSLLGIIFVVLMIYAGYNWMMAQGEEDKVVKAKDTLKRAIIGLAITVGAYAISYWVIYRLIIKSS